MRRVLYVHGGTTYSSREQFFSDLQNWEVSLEPTVNWNHTLERDISLLTKIDMPLKQDARYEEWKVLFEKYLSLVDVNNTIFLGYSLGGVFLTQYFLETKQEPYALLAVAPPFDKRDVQEELVGGFGMQLQEPASWKNVTFYFSSDDPVIPLSHKELFAKQFPTATIKIVENVGHFRMERFKELLRDIKTLQNQ